MTDVSSEDQGAIAMRSSMWVLASIVWLVPAAGLAFGQAGERGDARRMVLVELYTSQGCDMCPEAEKILGQLATRSDRIVPIAFHVDYFNKPWKDPYSDALYSRRQMAYNALYTKPKHPDYGLYYTPMLMIDGEQSVNGRDPASAEEAIRRALARKPQVSLATTLNREKGDRAGKLQVRVSSRSTKVNDRELLVSAVLRDDAVETYVESGENAKKTLTARFPARIMKYEFIELGGKGEKTLTFPFELDPSWRLERLRVAAFVQDKQNGLVYQAADMPWRPGKPAPAKADSSAPSSPSR